MLYDDSEQLEVRHVVPLAHYDVGIRGGGGIISEGNASRCRVEQYIHLQIGMIEVDVISRGALCSAKRHLPEKTGYGHNFFGG